MRAEDVDESPTGIQLSLQMSHRILFLADLIVSPSGRSFTRQVPVTYSLMTLVEPFLDCLLLRYDIVEALVDPL
jgi:hypothetical protein